MVVCKGSFPREKPLGDSCVVREQVEALSRAVIDAVDLGAQERRVAQCQEFFGGVGPLGPDVVSVVVVDNPPAPPGGLPASSIECRFLAGCQRLAACPAGPQGGTPG